MKDYQTGRESLTLACGLLFGTDDVIGSIAPAYVTDAIVRLHDEDRYDDRLTVRTNLIEAYDQLVEFCRKHLPDPFFLEGGERRSVRDIVARELIVNSLMHREFTGASPAKIIIDREGFKTENASRARHMGRVTLANFSPMPKNPDIAAFFVNIGRSEMLGSGIRKLFAYSRPFLGADPMLEEGDIFRACIPDAKGILASPSKPSYLEGLVAGAPASVRVAAAAFDSISRRGKTTVSEVATTAAVSKRTASAHLNELVKSGALEASGSTSKRIFFLKTLANCTMRQAD